MKRSWVLAAVVGLALVSMVFGASSAMTDQCVNGACVIVARTTPVGVLMAAAFLLLVIFHRPRPSTPVPGERVRLRARLGAFLIDVITVMSIVGPIAALPMLIYAAVVMGSFLWAVQVDNPDWWDHLIAAPLALGGVTGMVAYFCVLPRLRRQTLGQYVLGYRIVAMEGKRPNFALLGFLGFVGVCVWPVSLILAALRPDREFWWSRTVGVHAQRVAETPTQEASAQ